MLFRCHLLLCLSSPANSVEAIPVAWAGAISMLGCQDAAEAQLPIYSFVGYLSA